jgi:hypothetical protein
VRSDRDYQQGPDHRGEINSRPDGLDWHKHLHLSLASPPPTPLPKALQKLGAVWQDGRLSISFDPAKTTSLALLAEVQKAKCEVRDISTAESDLEEVFLSLTK